jgi:hypothetical protein
MRDCGQSVLGSVRPSHPGVRVGAVKPEASVRALEDEAACLEGFGWTLDDAAGVLREGEFASARQGFARRRMLARAGEPGRTRGRLRAPDHPVENHPVVIGPFDLHGLGVGDDRRQHQNCGNELLHSHHSTKGAITRAG